MLFSKSFGYALRGILYVALKAGERPVALDDMAQALGVPRHFMAKIMKRVVQQKILDSLKGPTGGFSLNASTLNRPLIDVYKVTDRSEELEQCVLSRGPCNTENPCRLHNKVLPLKTPLNEILYDTTISDLLQGNNQELLQSLTNTAKSVSPAPTDFCQDDI